METASFGHVRRRVFTSEHDTRPPYGWNPGWCIILCPGLDPPKVRERELAKFDAYRRAVRMLNPLHDTWYTGRHVFTGGGEGPTPVNRACREVAEGKNLVQVQLESKSDDQKQQKKPPSHAGDAGDKTLIDRVVVFVSPGSSGFSRKRTTTKGCSVHSS